MGKVIGNSKGLDLGKYPKCLDQASKTGSLEVTVKEYDSQPGVLGGYQQSIYTEIEIGVRRLKLLIDMGRYFSVLKFPLPGVEITKPKPQARGITGRELNIIAEQEAFCK
jgi:hypothetical protein